MTEQLLPPEIADELAHLREAVNYAQIAYDNSPWAMGTQRRRELDTAQDRLQAFKKKHKI